MPETAACCCAGIAIPDEMSKLGPDHEQPGMLDSAFIETKRSRLLSRGVKVRRQLRHALTDLGPDPGGEHDGRHAERQRAAPHGCCGPRNSFAVHPAQR